jgi:transcription elongation GreA/GreB family factor
MRKTNKQDLHRQLRGKLASELAVLAQAVRDASEAATHEESRPENKYDTRGLEASYLAGAQRERLGELQGMLKLLDATVLRDFDEESRIASGALVELDHDGVSTLCFVVPVGAGYTLDDDGRAVLTVTPQAPLGRALLGKTVGEQVTVRTAQGSKDYEVLAVL